jgi:predicted O-methyltransferase YrrM
MNELLLKACETRSFTNSKGQLIKMDSETPAGQCVFLQQVIRENKVKTSIEIGMAYGTSTLAIAEGIDKNGGTSCVVIDPYENSYWKGHGLELLKVGGYGHMIDFYEQPSYSVLPKFLEEGRKFDFAYIDSTKLMDWITVDFFYLDKLMDAGGIIVFDDVSYVSIKKLIRYLAQLPHYEVAAVYPKNKILPSVRKLILKNFVPGFLLKEDLRVTDHKLGINAHCVALRKIGHDTRNYDWHVPF